MIEHTTEIVTDSADTLEKVSLLLIISAPLSVEDRAKALGAVVSSVMRVQHSLRGLSEELLALAKQ